MGEAHERHIFFFFEECGDGALERLRLQREEVAAVVEEMVAVVMEEVVEVVVVEEVVVVVSAAAASRLTCSSISFSTFFCSRTSSSCRLPATTPWRTFPRSASSASRTCIWECGV